MTDALTLRGGVILLATVAMGLAAGLFYSFSIAVMRGLAQTDDRTFVSTMQQINVRILNGWFALSFGGALVLTLLAVVLHLGAAHRGVLWWVVVAAALYIAQLIITFGLNIPLNNALDAAGDPDRIGDLAAVRAAFEAKWVLWNNVRTWLSLGGFVSLLGALVAYGRSL